MRELKFRVWNEREKRMFEVARLGVGHEPQSAQGYVEIYGKLKDGFSWFISDTIMQYTGLKDKTGKEIYEGDIIRECQVNQVIWDDTAIIVECPIGEVIWRHSEWDIGRRLKGKVRKYGSKEIPYSEINLTTYDGLYQWPKDIEVIGNIYENPELLIERK